MYNNGLVLAYDFGWGGATINRTIVNTQDPTIHTFQEQISELYEPKFSTPGATAVPWSATNSIFSIFFGINE